METTPAKASTADMKFCLRILTLLLLITGTLSQDSGLDLFDALDDPKPTPAKPKEEPKAPEKPKPDGGLTLDLGDAVEPDPIPDKPAGGGSDPKPDKPANKPPKTGGGGGDGFNLDDALDPDLNPDPKKPVKPPQSGGGGGGSFDDSDLLDVAGGNYKPDGGRSGNSGNHDPHGGAGADQPQEAGAGPLAGIISSIGVALLGAASGYFAYQKKKLCFKIQGGQDPEHGNGQVRSDPQVYSDLLQKS